MKSLVLTLTLLSSLFIHSAKADTNSSVAETENQSMIFLGLCSNFGAGVSYSFSSCINSNFSTISSELGGFISYCSNFGPEVNYSFISCVNSGFRESARLLNNNIFLPDCYNFDSKNLDYSFISCVNSNFSQISRATL